MDASGLLFKVVSQIGCRTNNYKHQQRNSLLLVKAIPLSLLVARRITEVTNKESSEKLKLGLYIESLVISFFMFSKSVKLY